MTRRVVAVEEDVSGFFVMATVTEAMADLVELQRRGYTTLDYREDEHGTFAVFAQKWRDETEDEARVREELEEVRDRAYMEDR